MNLRLSLLIALLRYTRRNSWQDETQRRSSAPWRTGTRPCPPSPGTPWSTPRQLLDAVHNAAPLTS